MLEHGRAERRHRFRHLGIGQVMGEGAVQLGKELDHITADASQRLRARQGRDGVAGVRDHFDAPGQGKASREEIPILRLGVALAEGAPAALEIVALGDLAHPLDLIGGQGNAASLQQLHAVHMGRIVAAGHADAAIEAPVRGGEIEQGRRRQPDIDDRNARRANALDEAIAQRHRGRTVVPPRDDLMHIVSANEVGAVGAADALRHRRCQIVAHRAADVVGTEHQRVQSDRWHWRP